MNLVRFFAGLIIIYLGIQLYSSKATFFSYIDVLGIAVIVIGVIIFLRGLFKKRHN